MSNEKFDPRFDPAFQPGFESKADGAKKPKTSSPAKAALEAARTEAAAASVAVVADSEPRATTNPFLIALLALSAVLIVGGIGIAQWTRSLFFEDYIRPDLDFFTLDTLKIASPLAVALGVAIGAGVLFVYAIRWPNRDR